MLQLDVALGIGVALSMGVATSSMHETNEGARHKEGVAADAEPVGVWLIGKALLLLLPGLV